MALFDQFTAAQAGNGQSVPNPQTMVGAPGLQSGAWGHQPPNLAGGMRNFLQPNQFGQPMPPPQQGGIIPPGGPGGIGMPAPQMTGAMPGNMGMPMNGAGGNTASGQPNFAGGMQQFLGGRGMMR